jgi:hypothetical protein
VDTTRFWRCLQSSERCGACFESVFTDWRLWVAFGALLQLITYLVILAVDIASIGSTLVLWTVSPVLELALDCLRVLFSDTFLGAVCCSPHDVKRRDDVLGWGCFDGYLDLDCQVHSCSYMVFQQLKISLRTHFCRNQTIPKLLQLFYMIGVQRCYSQIFDFHFSCSKFNE